MKTIFQKNFSFIKSLYSDQFKNKFCSQILNAGESRLGQTFLNTRKINFPKNIKGKISPKNEILDENVKLDIDSLDYLDRKVLTNFKPKGPQTTFQKSLKAYPTIVSNMEK